MKLWSKKSLLYYLHPLNGLLLISGIITSWVSLDICLRSEFTEWYHVMYFLIGLASVFLVYCFYFVKSIDDRFNIFAVFQVIITFMLVFNNFRLLYCEIDLDERNFHNHGIIQNIWSIISVNTMFFFCYVSKVQRALTKELKHALEGLRELNVFVLRKIEEQNKANEICEENR